jgi:hypothetical protein
MSRRWLHQVGGVGALEGVFDGEVGGLSVVFERQNIVSLGGGSVAQEEEFLASGFEIGRHLVAPERTRPLPFESSRSALKAGSQLGVNASFLDSSARLS